MVDRVNTVAVYINADIVSPYSTADFINLLCLPACNPRISTSTYGVVSNYCLTALLQGTIDLLTALNG